MSLFYSQENQDVLLENQIFCGFLNGFFIDVGAHDGLTINNTLYFEKENNWSGINIEPHPTVYEKLIVNRPKSINLNCAISNETTNDAQFFCNSGYTEMISGLCSTFDSRHKQRLDQENDWSKSVTRVITVQTRRLADICKEYNITRIHYLTIDVEGAEFEVIKSLDFEQVFVDVIGFEANFDDTAKEIIEYLQARKYVKIFTTVDIIMIHIDSIFYNVF